MDKYIFAEPADRSALFILSSSPPFHLAKVNRFTEPITNSKDWLASKCPGYKVFISHVAYLGDDSTEYDAGDIAWIKKELQEKAMWYYDQRIHPNQPRFKKYLD